MFAIIQVMIVMGTTGMDLIAGVWTSQAIREMGLTLLATIMEGSLMESLTTTAKDMMQKVSTGEHYE